jgi:receptor protein-tyrosine kinase
VELAGLARYIVTLRERIGLVVACLAITLGAAILYLSVTDKTYEAEADLLVTPVASEDQLPGLGLIPESPDPTRDVETAARLVTQRDVAERVVRQLGLDERPNDVLGRVEAQPVAQSNLVSIIAEASTPKEARDLANAFGDGVVEERTDQLHTQLDKLIPSLRERVEADPVTSTVPGSLADQLSQAETLRAGPDPTLRVETRAAAPDSAAAPNPKLTIAAGILAGLVLGIGGAFALHAVDPRLRREDQLRELYRLPILARIPKETRAATVTRGARRFRIGPRRKHRRALPPGQLSPVTLEAYRSLRAMLGARMVHRAQHSRSVLVTGPSPSEGKTTTAINLASALALARNRVILIEADFRRPTVGEAMGVKASVGIGKVLLGNATLEQALMPAKPFGDNLRLLLVEKASSALPEVLSLPAAEALLEEAEALADYVVVDSPPLTEVIDALPIAQQVDDVVIVVRLGNSRLTQLERLGDLLAQNGIRPAGFAVVGVGSSEKDTYYLSAQRARFQDLPPEAFAESAEPSEPASRGAGSI